MNRKELLARVYVETKPWHSIDGWFCDQCGVECGVSEGELCPCCVSALDLLAADLPSGGGL